MKRNSDPFFIKPKAWREEVESLPQINLKTDLEAQYLLLCNNSAILSTAQKNLFG